MTNVTFFSQTTIQKFALFSANVGWNIKNLNHYFFMKTHNWLLSGSLLERKRLKEEN